LREKGVVDSGTLANVSLIDEHNGRQVRMGNLAFLGSHKVNGVSALHSELIKQTVFHDFHKLYPDRIVNKTNGVTFRRWLLEANPSLSNLIAQTIGPRVFDDATHLAELETFADDPGFQQRFAAAKRANKERLAKLILDRVDVRVDASALFDVQIKRIHEYKRQLLNVLHTIAL